MKKFFVVKGDENENNNFWLMITLENCGICRSKMEKGFFCLYSVLLYPIYKNPIVLLLQKKNKSSGPSTYLFHTIK